MWPHHPRGQPDPGPRGSRSSARSATCTVRSRSRFSARPTIASTRRGDGALLDVGIYCVAPAMLLADREPVACHAVAVLNELGVDVSTTGTIDWGAGFTSSFEVSFECPDRRTMEISGTEGFLTLEGDHEPPGTLGWHVPGPEEDSVVRGAPSRWFDRAPPEPGRQCLRPDDRAVLLEWSPGQSLRCSARPRADGWRGVLGDLRAASRGLMRGSDRTAGGRPVLVLQQPLVELAGRVAGQLLAEVDRARALDVGELRCGRTAISSRSSASPRPRRRASRPVGRPP